MRGRGEKVTGGEGTVVMHDCRCCRRHTTKWALPLHRSLQAVFFGKSATKLAQGVVAKNVEGSRGLVLSAWVRFQSSLV